MANKPKKKTTEKCAAAGICKVCKLYVHYLAYSVPFYLALGTIQNCCHYTAQSTYFGGQQLEDVVITL